MATYQQILTKINGITDNGNNTAAEVRSVLTDMLNFSGEGFEISTADLKDEGGYIYHYSFKGIKNQCCNLFFLIHLKSSTSGAGVNLTVEISDAELELLRPFMPLIQYGGTTINQGYLTYLIPESQRGTPRNLNLFLMRYQGRNAIIFTTMLEQGETITSAVAVNFKPYTTSGLNNSTKKETDAFLKNIANNFKPDNLK
jgi:hypothetical protein